MRLSFRVGHARPNNQGDTLLVTKVDLARSTFGLYRIVSRFADKGVAFKAFDGPAIDSFAGAPEKFFIELDGLREEELSDVALGRLSDAQTHSRCLSHPCRRTAAPSSSPGGRLCHRHGQPVAFCVSRPLTSHYDCFWHEGHIQRLQHSASASRDEADSWEVGHSRQNIMIVWKIDCPTIRTRPLI